MRSSSGDLSKALNYGRIQSDFTCFADVVKDLIRCLDRSAKVNPNLSSLQTYPETDAPSYRVFAINSSQPNELLSFFDATH